MEKQIHSDARAYFERDPEWDIYIAIFFEICRKFGISYASASEKEREFIAEVARVTYEIDKAKREGRPTSSVRPANITISIY